MTKLVARNASLGVDDSSGTCRAISGKTNEITLRYTAEVPEVTGFGDVVKQRVADSIRDVELTMSGFMDTGANETDIVMYGILGGSTRFVLGPSGSGSGCVMYTACTILSSYEMSFTLMDAAKISMTMVGRSGSLTRGAFA